MQNLKWIFCVVMSVFSRTQITIADDVFHPSGCAGNCTPCVKECGVIYNPEICKEINADPCPNGLGAPACQLAECKDPSSGYVCCAP